MNAKLTGHAPVLMVKDVEHSANWYKEINGFEIVAYYGEPRNFALIRGDRII